MALLGLSLWAKIALTFVFIQISMMAVTLYLHRDQAHRAIDLHPALRHFFRLWIWLTSGMVTREWVAVHRKHHAFCETENDPAQPGHPRTAHDRAARRRGLSRGGGQSGNAREIRPRHPDDWLERHLYCHGLVGIYPRSSSTSLLFGAGGITMFAFQMMTMPSLRGRRDQRLRPRDRLPQLRVRGRVDQPGADRASWSAARSCTTTTTPFRPPRASPCAAASSTSAGSTSACCRRYRPVPRLARRAGAAFRGRAARRGRGHPARRPAEPDARAARLQPPRDDAGAADGAARPPRRRAAALGLAAAHPLAGSAWTKRRASV